MTSHDPIHDSLPPLAEAARKFADEVDLWIRKFGKSSGADEATKNALPFAA